MSEHSGRPFYGEYAWAFDLLVDRPVARECTAMVGWLVERGVFPGSKILDAGCGTGRYARELARRGYVVDGVDRSPELIGTAISAVEDSRGAVSFRVGDLLRPPPRRYDAVLCRGVLNDLIEEDERAAVFVAFAGALRSGGVLVLDVREWEATKARKLREPLFRKSVVTNRGKLTFTSITELDLDRRQLLLSENHTLVGETGERSTDSHFVMRCWTRSELASGLVRAGFDRIAYFGAYDPLIGAGETDRLVAVAEVGLTSS